MSKFIIGGWTQDTTSKPKDGFHSVMYGMITNLKELTSGTPQEPGWSPKTTAAPKTYSKSIWSYGGAGCTPDGMPSNDQEVSDICGATLTNYWDGVDFDNECNMNVDNIIATINQLNPLESSFTFLAGWDFNNPVTSEIGRVMNESVTKINAETDNDRFILMFYADEMWSLPDLEVNVGPSIQRLVDMGVLKKKIIATVTTAGLDYEKLSYVLDMVISYNIGGLFIWDFDSLTESHLQLIKSKLGIL